MKSTSSSKNNTNQRKHKIPPFMIGFTTSLLAVGGVLAAASVVLAKPGNIPPQTFSNGVGDLTTFWSLTKLGGGISLAIFGVLALGVFLIALQIYELIQDKVKGKALMNINYRQMSVGEVNKLVMKHQKSYIAPLYSILLSIFHATGTTQDFHDEIANYIQMQQDRFGTFKSRLAFLSDTAGALGLLGTVWGMFVTFFGGNLDSQRILNGMGLALVTTLVGLVVSIILNFFATEVFSVFNKRLEIISAKADEFRLWLLAIMHQRNKKRQQSSGPDGNATPDKTEETKFATKQATQSAVSLKAASELSVDGIIGHTLEHPIQVLLQTQDGKSLSGVPVQFQITTGGGLLENRAASAWVKTNADGIAEISWTLGPQVGPQALTAALAKDGAEPIEFIALAQPFIPNLLDYTETPGRHANDGVIS